jgi:hypothetical protein
MELYRVKKKRVAAANVACQNVRLLSCMFRLTLKNRHGGEREMSGLWSVLR